MFEFLCSEVWMDVVVGTLIGVAITGVFTVASVLIGGWPKIKDINHKLELHSQDTKNNTEFMSKEHSDLSREHDILSNKLSRTHEQIGSVAQDVKYLRDEQIKRNERQAIMTGQQLDIQKTVEHIKSLASDVGRLQLENDQLHKRVTFLERQNMQLQNQLNQNQSHNRDDEWEMEP